MNEQLRALIADTLGINRDSVSSSLARESNDAWDSLGHLRLITALEQAFGVQFEMEEIQKAMTVADLEQLLIRHGVQQ